MLSRCHEADLPEAASCSSNQQVQILSGKAMFDGQEVPLTRSEAMVLEHLLERRSELVTKADLMRHLYGDMELPHDKIIDVFICKLRKKLAKAGASGVIWTVWGRGFSAYSRSLSSAERERA